MYETIKGTCCNPYDKNVQQSTTFLYTKDEDILTCRSSPVILTDEALWS